MQRMFSIKRLALILIPVLAAAVIGCKKEFDTPPVHSLPVGSVINIAQLKAMFSTLPVHFPQEMSVYAVVTADEQNGNLYKNVFVQDSTGGLELRLTSSGGLYQGDRIRIYLPGTVLSPYAGLMQLDSVNVTNNVVKQQTLVNVAPLTLTIPQIIAAAPGQYDALLVHIDSVEFAATDALNLWSDPVGQTNVNRTLEDCALQQVVVRTSGYANFAGHQLPIGKGGFTGILARYNSTPQLYVRNINEVQLTGPRCPGQVLPVFQKNFDDASVTSGGWSQWSDTNAVQWATNTQGSSNGTAYGQCRNYIGGVNIPCHTWLISPSINLSTTTAPVLSFITGWKYTGAALQLMVSTDYVSGAPSTGTWTPVTFTLSAGNFAWGPSGALSMTPYQQSNVHIAFEYSGTGSDGSTWEVDDIKIIDP